MNAARQPTFRTSAWLYFVIAFGVAWTLWLLPGLASHGDMKLSQPLQLACLFVGSFGPFFGALIGTYCDGGGEAVREFFGRRLRYRIGPIYLLVAVFLAPVLAGIAMWLLAHHGGPPYALRLTLSHLPELYLLLGYESNNRSILVALLFHTASNLSFNLYNLVDRSPQRDERGLIWWTLLMGLAAIVVALGARCYRSRTGADTAQMSTLPGGVR